MATIMGRSAMLIHLAVLLLLLLKTSVDVASVIYTQKLLHLSYDDNENELVSITAIHVAALKKMHRDRSMHTFLSDETRSLSLAPDFSAACTRCEDR